MTAAAAVTAVVDGVAVDAVAAAVRSCAAVDDLVGGRPVEIATYLPGRRVLGVQVGPDAVLIQVRARWGVPVVEVARQIRQALAGLAQHRRVDIIVADITGARGAGPPQRESVHYRGDPS